MSSQKISDSEFMWQRLMKAADSSIYYLIYVIGDVGAAIESEAITPLFGA